LKLDFDQLTKQSASLKVGNGYVKYGGSL